MNENDVSQSIKPKKSLFKKILNIGFYVIIALIIIFSLLATIASFTKGDDGYTRLFGYILQTVETDSMTGTFDEGDLIVSKELEGNEINELKVGDVISFYYKTEIDGELRQIIMSHKIIRIDKAGSSKVFITQGVSPKVLKDEVQEILPGNVIGIYTGAKFSGFGKFVHFLDTDTGFLACIILPLTLFLIWQVISFARTVLIMKKTKDQADIDARAMELAQKMFAMQNTNSNSPQEEEPQKVE